MKTYDKTLTKKLLAVHPEKVMRRKNEKKTRMAIAKLFALNANVIITESQLAAQHSFWNNLSFTLFLDTKLGSNES